MAKVECSKCAGTGKVIHMHVKGGVCFKCNGTGKVTKMKRVRVIDEWFSVEEPDFGTKHHAKTLEQAESIVAELDAMSYEGATKAVIIPKKSYHYENIPA